MDQAISQIDLGEAYLAPSATHWLGTDYLGRDLLARIGTAIIEASLPVMATVTIAFVVAGIVFLSWLPRRFPVPMLAGTAIIRSLPAGLFAFAVLILAGGQQRFEFVLLVIGMTATASALDHLVNCWERDRHLGYWDAHHAMGGSARRRALQLGMQQGWRQSILQLFGLTIQTSLAIEATLGYLGLGVQEPRASLGNIIAAHYDRALKGYPIPALSAVAALLIISMLPRFLTAQPTGQKKRAWLPRPASANQKSAGHPQSE
ncbi:MAG: hypothetical protein EBU49_01140 [Proteobacteria bacterium]|nr:hypothetical protein [Pseudomonadota bacterium]